MEIDILEETENDLLNRKEVKFEIVHEESHTPSRDTVRAKLAAIMNADADKTIIKKISGEFGRNHSIGYANVYNSEEAVSIEPKYVLKRNGLIEEEA